MEEPEEPEEPSHMYVPIKQTLIIPEEKFPNYNPGLNVTMHLACDEKEVKTKPNLQHLLEIFVSNQNGNSNISYSFCLFGIEKGHEISVKFSLSVKSANYFVIHDKVFTKSRHRCSYPFSSSFEEFMNPEANFFVDGKFVIEMKGLLIFEVFDGDEIPKVIANAGALSQSLWERDDKDFNIVVKNEGNINIHKLVLATQSDSFNGMLQSGMQEAITNILQITDFNLKTVGLAVEFFYERNIFETLTFDDAFELLRFADKYRIPNLQDKLEFYLSVHLSPATVCKFTNGSIYANSTNLHRECSDFLMLCSRFTIAVDDLEELNNEFAAEMFKKSFSSH